MLCSWSQLHAPGGSPSTRNRSSRRTTARTRSTTTSSSGTSTRPTTSRSTTTPRTSSTSRASRATPRARTSRSARTCGTTSTSACRSSSSRRTASSSSRTSRPGAAPEGVLAFAEGERNRMVLPIDLPSDLLYGLIVHELTHVFQYDFIPMSLLRRNIPLWVHEGGAEYERGIWDPLDLMTVRDAAVADIIPRMSQMEGYGDFGSPRLVYNLGHALYEFIEARWGKDGVRQFLFSLRKSAIGGGSSPYEEAFQMTAREFDQQFEKYLKDRFKAFRDKERPADYGQDLSPDPEKIALHGRDLDRAVAVGRSHRRDDRQPPRPGARHHPRVVERRRGRAQPHVRLRHGPRVRVHRAAEPQQHGAVDVVVARRRSPRLLRPQREVQDADHPERAHGQDRAAGSRCRASTIRSRRTSRPTAARCCSAACAARSATSSGSISTPATSRTSPTTISPTTRPSTRPTAASSSTWRASADRRSCSASIVDTGKKTQLTFGTQDEAAAKFLNADTIIFSSTATDPATPLTPEVARNGNIFNLWSLSLKNGELQAVHRRARRRALARRAVEGRRGAEAGVRRLLQGQLQPAHVRSQGAAAHGRVGRLRLARARSPTSRRRCSTRSSPRTSRRRAGSTRCSSTAGRR